MFCPKCEKENSEKVSFWKSDILTKPTLLFKKMPSGLRLLLLAMLLIFFLRTLWISRSLEEPAPTKPATSAQDKAIINFQGQYYDYRTIPTIEANLGKGTHTSSTNNRYGYIYFSKPNVTLKVNKNTNRIEMVLRGKH